VKVIDLDPVPLLSADDMIRRLADYFSQLDWGGDRILIICEWDCRSRMRGRSRFSSITPLTTHMIRVGQHLQRINVILSAEGIDRQTCDRVNLGYRDPATINESEFDGIVHHATDLILTP